MNKIDVTDIKSVDAAPFSLEPKTYDLSKSNEDVIGQNDFPVLTGGDLGGKWLGINKVKGLAEKAGNSALFSTENGRQFLTLLSPYNLIVTNKGAMSLSL
jgi:hypothetical protein